MKSLGASFAGSLSEDSRSGRTSSMIAALSREIYNAAMKMCAFKSIWIDEAGHFSEEYNLNSMQSRASFSLKGMSPPT